MPPSNAANNPMNYARPSANAMGTTTGTGTGTTTITTGSGPYGTAAPPPAESASSTGNTNKKGPIYIDTQHDDMIHDAQMDYYGTKLATCSSDRTIKIYDVHGDTYTHSATLQGHTGPVWSLSWSHPQYGTVLASACFSGSVLLHRETRPREWTLLHNARNLHDSSVNCVRFAPPTRAFGLLLAAASSDGRVSVLTHGPQDDSWMVEYLDDPSRLGVNSLSFAPVVNGTAVTALSGGMTSTAVLCMVTGGCDFKIRFWSKTVMAMEEGNMSGGGAGGGGAGAGAGQGGGAVGTAGRDAMWVLDTTYPVDTSKLSHKDWIRDVAWAPCLSPTMQRVASCSEDRTVLIWTLDLSSVRKEEGKKQSPMWVPQLLHTFEDPVWRVSWSLTGNILAVSSGDDCVTLWKQTLDGTWMQVSSVLDEPQQQQQQQQQQQREH